MAWVRFVTFAWLLMPVLVDVGKLNPGITVDIRYATANNFLGTPVYPVARAFLERPAAEALAGAAADLKAKGFGLRIHNHTPEMVSNAREFRSTLRNSTFVRL